MILTPNEAKLLLSNAEPCEVCVRVRDSDFERTGIPLETLKTQSFY